MSAHQEASAITDPDAYLHPDETTSAQEDVIFEPVNQTKLAFQDIKEGLKKWPVWVMLAYQDIKLRYRRSVLGPFWLTISMAITVYSMGFLYSRLFHMQLENYFPFLVSGMLAWTFIATMVTDFAEGLASSENLLKQVKLPYTLYIHRIACRNFIIFFHNSIVLIPILILYPQNAKINFNTLLLLPGLIVIYYNAITFGMLISMIGARFRDMVQIIKSLVQVIFFVTPIMWSPSLLGPKGRIIVGLNPFYAFVQLVRAPLIGSAPTLKNILLAATMTVISTVLSWKMFKRYRAKIVYWL